jgi:hypothetical protein
MSAGSITSFHLSQSPRKTCFKMPLFLREFRPFRKIHCTVRISWAFELPQTRGMRE